MVMERPAAAVPPEELTPTGRYLLASQHEGRRAGVRVLGVALAAAEPLLLAVTIRCGHWIEPLIRDSHHFALSRLDGVIGARLSLLLRRCDEPSRPRDLDVFDMVGTGRLISGSPVLTESSLVYDCEVVRHMDLEADHELYVARVIVARVGAAPGVLVEPKPAPRRPMSNRR